MGSKGAVEILYKSDQKDPEKTLKQIAEYEEKFTNPFIAAERGFIDDIIVPRNSRRRIARAFISLRGKDLKNPWKKHDNIPL